MNRYVVMNTVSFFLSCAAMAQGPGTSTVPYTAHPAIGSGASAARFRLRFYDADVNIVLQAFGAATGRTLIQHPGLPRTNITLVSESAVSLDEFCQAVETKLANHQIRLDRIGESLATVVPLASREYVALAPPLKVGEGKDGTGAESWLRFNNAPLPILLEVYAEKAGMAMFVARNLPNAVASLRSTRALAPQEYLQAIEYLLRCHGIKLVFLDSESVGAIPAYTHESEKLRVIAGLVPLRSPRPSPKSAVPKEQTDSTSQPIGETRRASAVTPQTGALAAPATSGAQTAESVKVPGDYAYMTNAGERTITIMKYIGTGEDVSIPGAINGLAMVNLGSMAFMNCSNLTSLRIPAGVTSIGRTAISRCNALTNVVIPNTVTTIRAFAFEANPSLPSLTIPASVTTIEMRAFSYCQALAEVHFEGDAPRLGSNDIFYATPGAVVYYRPGTKGWGPTFGGRPTKEWKE